MKDKSETIKEAQKPELDAINQAALTPPVRSALNSKTVDVINWEDEQLHAGAGEWTAVYRFSGHGIDQEKTVP